MKTAFFRFYAELNDFLAPPSRGLTFEHRFRGAPAVKDVVEALGVPHGEVDLLLVNGHSVGFTHPLSDGDRVSVYPRFEALDVAPVQRVRAEPLRQVRFLLDGHLGRLAAGLRMLGFDTDWAPQADDEDLANRSAREGRILLTRDKGLLKRSVVTHGSFVRATSPTAQLEEVVARFDLARLARPFTRCLRCNGTLSPAEWRSVEERLPPRVRERRPGVRQCDRCGHLYWRGTHVERMEARIAALTPSG